MCGLIRWGMIVVLGLSAGLGLMAQGGAASPAVVAALMPKSAEKVSGDFVRMGIMGKGQGVGKIPFDQKCQKCLDSRYRAQISVELLHYGDEGADLFRMQIGAVEEQTLENALQNFRRQQPKATPANHLNPTRKESLSGGSVVLYDFERACPLDCAPDGVDPSTYTIKVVHLVGVSHTDSSSVVVKVDGDLPVDLARAAVQEVFQNLQKARFGS